MRFLIIGAAITGAAAMSGCGLVLMILTWVFLQLGYAIGVFLISRIPEPKEATGGVLSGARRSAAAAASRSGRNGSRRSARARKAA
jgi:hypothetical protein